jgi:hypothetical protein
MNLDPKICFKSNSHGNAGVLALTGSRNGAQGEDFDGVIK